MIITKTPLRIGFAGGGSDMPSYFQQSGRDGFVVNCAIDKYVYVIVKQRHDRDVFLKYSENEIVDCNNLDHIRHDFIRETLKLFADRGLFINGGIEIINFADIPTKGTGLGSSSSFLVGLILALNTLMGTKTDTLALARDACFIEIERCHKPIGHQDQFAAAFGGLNAYRFPADSGNVFGTGATDKELEYLSSWLLMFWTGRTRDSGVILTKQNNNAKANNENMDYNVDLAEDLHRQLLYSKRPEFLGEAMRQNWELKKTFAQGISDSQIDVYVDTALDNGAIGCKVTGAGGGGFLVVCAEPSYHQRIRKSLNGLREMPVRIDKYGSRVLLDTEMYVW